MDACCVPGIVFKLFKCIISSVPIEEALFLAHGKLKTCRLHYFLEDTQLAGLGNLISDVSSWFSPFSGKPPTYHSRRIHAFSYLLFLLSPIKTIGSIFQGPLSTLPSNPNKLVHDDLTGEGREGYFMSIFLGLNGVVIWVSKRILCWKEQVSHFHIHYMVDTIPLLALSMVFPPQTHFSVRDHALFMCIYCSSLDSKGLTLLSAHSCRCGKKVS